jgi:predicted RNase H-like HicB family nuclease
MNTKYEVLLYWSNDDNAFLAEVPELPGCIAHGETQESALKNIQEAIDLWIDTARETGLDVPQAKCRKLMYA